MRERKPVQPLLGIVSEYPAHLARCSAGQVASALRCCDMKSAQDAEGERRKSQSGAFARSATKGSLPTGSVSSTRFSKRKSDVPLNRLGNTGKPSASTRRRVKKTPAYVGNMAFPASGRGKSRTVEKTSICLNECLAPGQIARFPEKKSTAPQTAKKAKPSFPMVPRTREEIVACLKLAAAGAALWVGVPAVMSLLHLGGVW